MNTLLAAAALLALGQTPAPTNLLPPLGTPAWKPRAWAGDEAAKWTVDKAGRHGQACFRIRSEKGSDAAWTATVPVEPGARYCLSGWIRTRQVRGAFGALLNIQNLQQVKTSWVHGTSGWTHVQTVFGSGRETELQINCLFGGWGCSTGQAWYDDIRLERVPDMTDQPRATVTIDATKAAKPYSRFVFGGFLEHFDGQVYGGVFDPGSPLADEKGFRKDVIAAMKELRLSIVRWPGGCFASGYHWRDGVGTDRKPTPDPVWGVTDPNTFGTDEFIEWCRRVGCEPYICTNAGNGTAEEMRAWVEYCNGPRGAKQRVRYWSIGNENWGAHEIGARTPQEWAPLVHECADETLDADPSLKLLAAATVEGSWTLPLLAEAGRQLQYVAIHEYWLPLWGDNQMPGYLACIANSEGPEFTLNRVANLLDDAGCRGRVKVAFDEWNLRGWHHPGFPRKAPVSPDDAEAAALVKAREKNAIASQYTMADALFSASFLNACLRHADDVGMANIAPIVNTRGPLYVHPGGIVRRTTFHVLAMYANLLGDRVAPCEVIADPLLHETRSVAVVDALATCDRSRKKWRIALINRHPSEAATCTVSLGVRPLSGTYGATVLSGDSADAYNDVAHPDRVVPRRTQVRFEDGHAELPPHSLTVVEVGT